MRVVPSHTDNLQVGIHPCGGSSRQNEASSSGHHSTQTSMKFGAQYTLISAVEITHKVGQVPLDLAGFNKVKTGQFLTLFNPTILPPLGVQSITMSFV